MISRISFSLIIFSQSIYGQASDTKCEVTPEKLSEYLNLDFTSFDQTEGEGHRELGLKGCYLEAAKTIDVYFLNYQSSLEDWQRRVLYFHAGQTYAQASIALYQTATKRFRNSFNPNQGENPELEWNGYVHATIAFLERNFAELGNWRKVVAEGSPSRGNSINLKVIDAMIRCYDKPYVEVYSDKCIE